MKYYKTLTINAYNDVFGNPFVVVNDTAFRVYLPDSGETTSNPPRVQFRDGDGELAHPGIYALTMQAAIGAACKVMVDRDVAPMALNPFEKVV